MISPSYVDGLELRIKELTQSNRSFVSALQKAEAYNVQLENDRDAWVSTIGHMTYLIERVYDSYKNNTGYEPSLSVFHRDLEEAYSFLDKTPKQCLAEIDVEAVLTFAGTVLDITEWAKEYADKVRKGEL